MLDKTRKSIVAIISVLPLLSSILKMQTLASAAINYNNRNDSGNRKKNSRSSSSITAETINR
jgi:hypothetical protein